MTHQYSFMNAGLDIRFYLSVMLQRCIKVTIVFFSFNDNHSVGIFSAILVVVIGCIMKV